ncbi:hypothetical protein PMAYCL1PPCAC_23564, partial [Pristionchus mayeri]
YPSYSTMRLLLLSSLSFVLISCSRWADYDVLSAHGGVFKALPWTTQELLHVSSLHSRAEYHKLMPFIKEKLIESRDDLSPSERTAIERFLVAKRPPPMADHLFDEEEKQSIDDFHSKGLVSDVIAIWSQALQRLPDKMREKMVEYLSTS